MNSDCLGQSLRYCLLFEDHVNNYVRIQFLPRSHVDHSTANQELSSDYQSGQRQA